MQNYSNLIDRALGILHPPLRIGNSSWASLWVRKERLAFKKIATITWTLFAIIYILHYFLIDQPLHKTPIELWFKYRFGLATLCSLTVFLINSKYFDKFTYYRLPVIITGLACSYFQAESMIWRPELPYFFTILVAVCAALSLNTSSFLSSIFLITAYLLGMNAWLFRSNDFHTLMSAGIVGILFICIIRTRLNNDVSLFISEQIQLETQKQLIEKQQEINEHIRSFLPKKIYEKFINLISKDRLSITQAMDEVMRPKITLASCLYSDIRGFTQLVKKEKNYIINTVLASQKTFNDIIQEYNGIPRNTGDLVFAFFEDESNPVTVIKSSLMCAIKVIKKQIELNSYIISNEKIKRYVLISYGPGIIGNTGGIDGNRDIAIFGDCANILSRVDELTKNQEIKEFITNTSIILTQDAADLVVSIFKNIHYKEINLKSLKLNIRDFPEQNSIFIFDSNDIYLALEKPIVNEDFNTNIQRSIRKAG